MSKPQIVCVGSIDHDPVLLAGNVMESLIDGDKTLWTEQDGRVYVGPLSEAEWIPRSWKARSFGMAQSRAEIETHLRAVRAARETMDASGRAEQPFAR